MEHPNRDLIALGIRQPWAELILRGVKTIEVRSLPTAIRGPIYLYTSRVVADTPAARAAADRAGLDVYSLPRGVLVGTINIVDSRPLTSLDASAACVPEELLKGKHGWRISAPQRLETPITVRFLPYGVWFYPFKRKGG